MKKLLKILTLAAITVFLLPSCGKDDSSNEVYYTFGSTEFALSDLEPLKSIVNVYSAEFQKIEDAEFLSGSSFQTKGNWKKSDDRVIEACKAAEAICRKEGCDIISGYILFEVTATYYDLKESKVIYSKEFGTPPLTGNQ